ncbi:hypothetical protein EVAR_45773_1 [Eumeta japonica]|uniref:Uncharacterized protein n=1 Tax=Eumeta variegata TaxID=151549 RepID=A0A4C1WZU4_EUMVA|nr:hypothetical protein EVAR_45773_1 [Eumeta japonica]
MSGTRCGPPPPPSPSYASIRLHIQLADLAPSDFHLFPGLEEYLKGQRLKGNDAVVGAVQKFLDVQD